MPRPRRSQPGSTNSRKQVESPDDGWFTIKRILEERVVRGRIEYLVDWDDNKTTGEVYAPTWSREVTDEAKQEWESLKVSRSQEGCGGTQDSQPPRPSNWRQLSKLQRVDAAGPSSSPRSGLVVTDDQGNRPSQVHRVARRAASSEEPVPSIGSTPSADSLDCPEAFGSDCFAPWDLDAHRSQQLIVALQKNSDLDKSEYTSEYNTQSSGHTSQSVAELEDQDERALFASQLNHQIIPDSQEPSGQTWSVVIESTDHFAAPAGDESVSPSRLSVVALSPISQQDEPFGADSTSLILGGEGSQHLHIQEALNGPDIPSNQFGQAQPTSLASRQFHLATPATKSNPKAQSPEATRDWVDTPVTSPAFLSQPPVTREFDVPESSVSHGHGAVRTIAETPSYDRTKSAGTSSAVELTQESQDAQVIEPIISQIGVFSDSHDTDNHGTAVNSHATPQDMPLSQPLDMDRQENLHESPNPAPSSSAVDELSRLVNLDNVMTEGSIFQKGKQTYLDTSHFATPLPNLAMQKEKQLVFGSNESAEHENTPASGAIVPDALHSSGPHTVSLADISTSQHGVERTALPLMPSLSPQDEPAPSNVFQSSGVPFPMAQPKEDSDDDSSETSQEPIPLKHIITLPFQARLRPLYDDILLDSKKEITQFGAIFNSETYVEPDDALVQKIDDVFGRLHNICDYPPECIGTALESLPSTQLIKYCRDANAKFNFLYELLQGLTEETRVLIVARSAELLSLLYRLCEALHLDCVCEDIGRSQKTSSNATVTLVLPTRMVDEDDFDVVIGYDHFFGASEIGKKLEPVIPDARSPLVLILVTIHSIEHIDLYLPEDLTPLEKKNALMSGIVRARQFLAEPDRGLPEPHEPASVFLDYLNGLAKGIAWNPVPVPEEILDIYVESQSRSQMPTAAGNTELENARKRKLDDSEDENAKRMRVFRNKQPTAQVNNVPLPEDVKALLGSVQPEQDAGKAPRVLVSVPLAVLQALAEHTSELNRRADAADRETQYKSVISTLETRVKEYERSSAKMYSSQRSALEDRSKFEQQARKAEAALQKATEVAQRDAEKAQKRITDLEATVARLTAGSGGADDDTPLAKTQQLLQTAQGNIQTLEKRLENARKDAEYTMSLYQDGTTTSSALRGENADLREQVADLQKKTEETMGKIHAIQADKTTKQYVGQIRNLKTQLRERDIQLDLMKEEIRQLKNGRRDTRQFMTQPPGNGRWNHLRE
ncbi:uncharacterized protein UV8b_02738 [Ustilaginoidea virens]|uniref:Chromo domain-containing protein n=1 Tax=Ustilaginoidea virens TaxID=1159556 RepID=A0A8E5MG42_USTVR|nr:uncharacterized protein UV8b_02738 [Ustilaginoidea virens]QUC18497.1 hypothetical protein UV8b_02738 [Ustilaginoidea virens]